MKKAFYLSLVIFTLMGSNVFAQTNKEKKDKYYLSKMSFGFAGKTWVSTRIKYNDGRTNMDFVRIHGFLIDKGIDIYKLLPVTKEDKEDIVENKLKANQIKFKLQYHLVSCGIALINSYLIKQTSDKLVFSGPFGEEIFIAKR